MTDFAAISVAPAVFLSPSPASPRVPALIAAAGDKAGLRFLEFFAAQIRNPNTRRAYARAAGDFFAWCATRGLMAITDVRPIHVAAWIEAQTKAGHAAPSVKQRLAALRHLFDWLVVGQIMPTNPAGSVVITQGCRHAVMESARR